MSARLNCLLLITVAALGACREEEVAGPERVRAIKAYTVTEAAGGSERRYSGSIIAADSSTLSFAASGTVETVLVAQGDRVTIGQVLATLDPKPFQLDVDAAKSQLRSAEAEHDEKALNLQRQQTLYSKQIVAKAAVDKAEAAAGVTQGDVEIGRVRVAQAERDLEKTNLRSPFDGVIADRSVEPFVEVSAGQTLFTLNSDDGYELVLSIPDSDIHRVVLGQPLSIDVNSVPRCGCSGKIVEIGRTSGAANAVTVRAALAEKPAGLLPGSTAEATMVFAGRGTARGFLVPIIAIAPGDGANDGFLFKYSADTGQISKVPIKAAEGRDNLIEVTEGVELGDVIAMAGVSFLRDGQKVSLLGN